MSQRFSAGDLNSILQSVSDVLFPADDGATVVRIDSRSSEGDTPLHVFAWRNDVRATELLLEAGADVNAIGDMGETPLHIAVRANNAELVAALLKAGADAGLRSEFGETPNEAGLRAGGAIAEVLASMRGQKGDA